MNVTYCISPASRPLSWVVRDRWRSMAWSANGGQVGLHDRGIMPIAGDDTKLAVRKPYGFFVAFDTDGEVCQTLIRCVGVAMVSGLYCEVYHASLDVKGPLHPHPGGSRRSVHRGLWRAADGDRRLPLVQRLGAGSNI